MGDFFGTLAQEIVRGMRRGHRVLPPGRPRRDTAVMGRPFYNSRMPSSAPRTDAAPSDVLAARREHQRRRALALSPAERLAEMDALIADAWRLLERNPTALRHFVRRNHHRRRAEPGGETTHDGT